LERRDAIIARWGEIFALYNRLLSQVPGIGLQPVASWAELSPWMYCVTMDDDQFGSTRDELAGKPTEAGLDSRPVFIPQHSLPPFREESRQRREHLPTTDSLSQTAIMLPTYTKLTDDQVTYICGTISDACCNRVGLSQFRRAA
jgi:perosamine synthetase